MIQTRSCGPPLGRGIGGSPGKGFPKKKRQKNNAENKKKTQQDEDKEKKEKKQFVQRGSFGRIQVGLGLTGPRDSVTLNLVNLQQTTLRHPIFLKPWNLKPER